LEQTKVKFPKIIQHKKTKAQVTIYGKSKGGERKEGGGVTQPYPFYRICWRVAGQRRMQSFRTYSEAMKAAWPSGDWVGVRRGMEFWRSRFFK
jgi:hypothetical protein